MKKIKELLIFIALLITPLIMVFVALGIGNLISPSPSFIGFDNYVRLFLNDKTFLTVLFNTFAGQIIISFIVSAVLAVIVFLLRKKIKAPRLIFYIGSISLGTVASFIRYARFLHISLNVLIPLYAAVITALIFWILELIISLFVKRGCKNEK